MIQLKIKKYLPSLPLILNSAKLYKYSHNVNIFYHVKHIALIP